MRKNLRHDLRTIVMDNFKEGQKKYDIKHEKRETIGVWSYGTRADLLDKINTFSEWCKDEGITKIERVDRELITRFLEKKSNEGCTDRTVEAYRSALRRIGMMAGEDWGTEKVVSRGRAKAADRGAGSVISKNDYDKLLDYCRENPSKSSVCVLLEREIGVRAGDLAYGIKIENNELKINSKNGRICTREITPEISRIINSDLFKGMVDEQGRVHAPKDNSLNKFLSRTEDRLGIERHSFHDLRRYRAQEKYDEYRNSGSDRTQALNKVGEWLNHGNKRATMVLESYIGNAW